MVKVEHKRQKSEFEIGCCICAWTPGIFKACHAIIPPEQYFENCVFDMCATDGQVQALCQAIESYADMCAAKGVIIEWRTNTFCRKFVFVLLLELPTSNYNHDKDFPDVIHVIVSSLIKQKNATNRSNMYVLL